MESANNIIIETQNITKDFGGLVAVEEVSFALRQGELRSLIGPNGAGKTTFFNLLSGHLKPTRGVIRYKGINITNFSVHERSRLGISRSFQITNIFPRMSTLENIRIAVQSRKVTFDFWSHGDRYRELKEKAENILELVKLQDEKDAPAGTLSYGQQRYLEIGITLATDPELLLLDEPTAGMSPEESHQTAMFIRELAQNRTILLVEHDMDVVMEISDSITVLHNGKVLCEGSPAEIRSTQEVQRVYLREDGC